MMHEPITDLPELPERAALVAKVLAAVEGFRIRSGMSETEIQRLAVVPKRFLSRMREGEGFNYDTAQRLIAWLHQHWSNPEGAKCAA